MTKTKKTIILSSLTTLVFLAIFSYATFIFAQGTYIPLAPLPSAAPAAGTSFSVYVRGLFGLLIGVAAVLAVVMIVLGGIEYMSTDAVYGKSDGKERITQALYGLLIAISCWLILYTINPNLLKFDILNSVPNTPVTTAPGNYWKVRHCFYPGGEIAPPSILSGPYDTEAQCLAAPPPNYQEEPPFPGCSYSSVTCRQPTP